MVSEAATPSRVTFSVIDQAIHLLDVPTAPWSIQLEVRVEGHLDEARLRAAIAVGLGHHPMARVRKLPSRLRSRMDHWCIESEPALDPLRVVDCPDDESLTAARSRLQGISVPLTESPPLRVLLARHPGGDVVMLNVNHAAMDGYGVLRLLQSITRAYSGEDDPIPPLDFDETRHVAGNVKARPWIRIRRQLALTTRLRDLVAPPARVAGDGAADEAGYGFVHSSLSQIETKALVDGVQAMGGIGEDTRATVNDALLAGLHLAIADWNAQHQKPCRRIGVLVPANLRPAEWREEVAGNFSLPARISTNRRQRQTTTTALQAVAAQTQRKKQVGMGTAFIELLGRTRLLPLWAKRLLVLALPLTGNRLVDTAMLSNLGRVDMPPFGDGSGEGRVEGRVEELWFSPPARMPLGLTIGVATVAGRLHLVLRYRNRQFDHAAAIRFADLYVRTLGDFSGADAVATAGSPRRGRKFLPAA